MEGICEEDVSPVEKVELTDQVVEVFRLLVAVCKGNFWTNYVDFVNVMCSVQLTTIVF